MRGVCHHVEDKQDEGSIMMKGVRFYRGMTTEWMRMACSVCESPRSRSTAAPFPIPFLFGRNRLTCDMPAGLTAYTLV
jgi:hypothetical protein